MSTPPLPPEYPAPHDGETLEDWRRRMAGSPELEALHRLVAAVEHYERMGWLRIPVGDSWKFDDLMRDCRALVGKWR